MKATIRPSLDEFRRLARKGNLVPVYMDVLADRLTPVSLVASRWDETKYAFLLESVEGGERLGRYSMASFDAEAVLVEKAGRSTFMTPDGKPFLEFNNTAADALARHMACVKPVEVPGLPRFYGGAVGYFSYETVHSLERVPRTNPDQLGWPEAQFILSGDLYVFDNTQQILKIITTVRLDKKTSVDRAYRAACARLTERLRRVTRPAKSVRASRPASRSNSNEFESTMDRRQYMAAVRKAKEYIGCGDIIQVVLARRQDKKTTATPLEIYRCLRVVNPSPYMYLLKLDGRAIIGSSPESLVRLENGVASTRPIAGTRRRGKSAAEDEALERELLRDPKERAEHLMLVDLGRNDLGRVCEFGSVKVPTFMKIERYSHVMHIVSEVSGRLQKDKNAFDLMKAVFPAGTVAGAPKIRAMEIINELEPAQRGPYAGALGYISYGGNMDLAITIRTALWENGRVSLQTGAGLVADSDPASEYQETENKAAAMKQTIALAESGRLFWERV